MGPGGKTQDIYMRHRMQNNVAEPLQLTKRSNQAIAEGALHLPINVK